jgi:anti-sigma B factor antagonist
MLNFNLRTERRGDSVVVGFDGDVDIQVARDVRAQLEEIEASSPPVIVLDLSRTTFLDSAGMALIAAAHGRARDAGRRLLVVRPRLGVDQAFKVSGVEQIFDMVDDVEQAFAGGG